MNCPCCGGSNVVLSDDPQVFRCRCGAVFTHDEPITLDQARAFVRFSTMRANAGPDGSFYFDLDVYDPIIADWRTANRLHGWADTKTREVIQWG